MKKEYRILSATAALLLLLGTVTGCAQGEPAQAPETAEVVQTQEPAAAPENTAPAAEEKGGDGAYTAVAKGFGGDVTVTVKIEGGKIAEVTAEGPEETEGVGSRAIAELPGKILEAGGADVDAVSGATVTSSAIRTAAADALRQAAGEETPALSMRAGTYTAQAKGHTGYVVAKVKVSETAIESVELVETIPSENPLIDPDNVRAAKALALLNDQPNIVATVKDALPERIVAAQSLAVDAISGATATSQGLLAAVKDCLLQAGAEEAALYAPVEKSAASEEYTCDVVVVGAGTSGSAAAAKAAQGGAKVILVEKSGRLGGTGALSSTLMALDADSQIEAGYEFDADNLFEQWMSQVHWYAKGNLIRTFLRESADTANWLAANGFDLVPVKPTTTLAEGSYGTHISDQLFSHYSVKYAEKSTYSTMSVNNYFESLVRDVDTVLFETTGKSLILDESGAIAGVEAVRWDGTKVTIHAPAVIVATGGYAGNAEMMVKYNGYSYKMLGLQQNVGEGFEMMLEAGAAEKNPGGTCAHQSGLFVNVTGEGLSLYDTAIPYTIANCSVLMRVDHTGARFMDEDEKTDSAVGSTNYMLANGSYYWAILSQPQLEILKAQGLQGLGQTTTPPDSYLIQPLTCDMPMENIEKVFAAGQEQGVIFKADTLEELAELTGMDARTLKDNVARYDQWCAEGKDGDYSKLPQYLSAIGGKGPFYAVQGCPLVYNSLGSVDVDEYMRVLNDEGRAIPGLYSVGVESIGNVLDGVAYVDLRGVCLGWGFNSGKIAGREAAAYVKGK